MCVLLTLNLWFLFVFHFPCCINNIVHIGLFESMNMIT